MLPIEPLGLEASQWHFLADPERYVAASERAGRPLVLESTKRQLQTVRDVLERLNGSHERPRRGLLLADDVGLGKTTVAALVAWVVASAGRVRVLAPNDVMMRRWGDELLAHVELLQKCAPDLGAKKNRVKVGKVRRLSAGSIQVVKHSYAASDFLACDLLIIDEAHRAKGEHTAFRQALERQKKQAQRVLVLTATPFSIRLEELQRMLTLIGGDEACGPIRDFCRALDDLHTGSTARSADVMAERLASKAKAAVDALSPWVIRHGVNDLPDERDAFGDCVDWSMEVPPANSDELELMLRMDRALRVARGEGSALAKATNDPRFHVGWRHLDVVLETLEGDMSRLSQPAQAVVASHLASMKRLRSNVGVHSKVRAVGAALSTVVEQGEKVLVFCHHHATAQELTAHLASLLPCPTAVVSTSAVTWRAAWDALLEQPGSKHRNEAGLRSTFIDWLCSDLIRTQTERWITSGGRSPATDLVRALRDVPARHLAGPHSIGQAAQSLYRALLKSRSTRGVLRAAQEQPKLMPGASGADRVLGVCEPSERDEEASIFIHNQQPDTVIEVFNSPFGPDVLVVTDRLSEGVDLHRYCRHLVHYELDPSPVRTVQRNGRLRRVNSWAAVTARPIAYAYPAFPGTRDHRLVQIMKKRIDNFSLLLGGAQDFVVDDTGTFEERWRNEVIAAAKGRLETAGRCLRARTS